MAACLALVVSGCGGGSSSAPATGDSTSAQATGGDSAAQTGSTGAAGGSESSASPAEPGPKSSAGGARGSNGANGKGGGGGNTKKHPPLELPSGEPESGPTKAQESSGAELSLTVALPGGLTADNSCKGKDESPAITWEKMPPGTKEVAIVATAVQPVGNQLDYVWAVAGLDPGLKGLKAGEVPAGAILGRTTSGKNGYSLCPQGSAAETYIFTVFAIESDLTPSEGFDPATLRKEAARASDKAGGIFETVGG